MISQKYQSIMSTEAWSKSTWLSHNGQVQNDQSKTTRRYFFRMSKMGPFLPKFLIKKKGILVVHSEIAIVATNLVLSTYVL
jgi:hypothetical protein